MTALRAIFVASPTVAGAGIRWVDGGPFDHCGLVIGSEVIEATAAHGVRKRLLSSMVADRPVHEFVDFTVPGPDAAIIWAYSAVGMGYDFASVGALAIRKVFGTAPNLTQADRFFCDALVLTAALHGGRTVDRPVRTFGVEAARQQLRAWS